MLLEESARDQRNLPNIVLGAFAEQSVSTACFVADHLLTPITNSLEDEPLFTILPVAREDEGLGILAGAYLGGQRGAMFMQSSGFALCANAIGSLLIPYQIPIVMFIGLRGDLGEFNVAQMTGGQSVEPTCKALGVPYWVPETTEEFERILPGAIQTAFSVKAPVAIGIRRSVA